MAGDCGGWAPETLRNICIVGLNGGLEGGMGSSAASQIIGSPWRPEVPRPVGEVVKPGGMAAAKPSMPVRMSVDIKHTRARQVKEAQRLPVAPLPLFTDCRYAPQSLFLTAGIFLK